MGGGLKRSLFSAVALEPIFQIRGAADACVSSAVAHGSKASRSYQIHLPCRHTLHKDEDAEEEEGEGAGGYGGAVIIRPH